MINFLKKEKNLKKEKDVCLNIGLFWKLAVCLMFIAIITAFFFGYRLFMEVNREPVLEIGENNSQLETIKKDRIDKVLEYFSTRKQKSNQILNSPAPVSDPSL